MSLKTELLERNQLREATNWMLRLVARINRMNPDDPVAEEAITWLLVNDSSTEPESPRINVA